MAGVCVEEKKKKRNLEVEREKSVVKHGIVKVNGENEGKTKKKKKEFCYEQIIKSESRDIISRMEKGERERKERKRRRNNRIDSSESSDSGVAALSNTESSQSSAASDFTEPCSPPSPDTPRSCTPLQSSGPCCPCGHGFVPTLTGTLAMSPTSATQDGCTGLACFGGQEALPFRTGTGTTTTTVVVPQPIDLFDRDGSDVLTPSTRQGRSLLSPTRRNSNLVKDGPSLLLEEPQQLSGTAGTMTDEGNGVCDQFLRTCESYPQSLATSDSEARPFPVVIDKGRSAVADPKPAVLAIEAACAKLPPVFKVAATVPASAGAAKQASTVPDVHCLWEKCSARLKSGSEVVEHLQSVHVSSQVDAESFVCLWATCKVYKKASCSFSWLERHVMSHAGNKPFQCIVDGCGHRFTTQGGLERHVNGHFNNHQPGSGSGSGSGNGGGGSGNGNSGAGSSAVGSGGTSTATSTTARRKDDTPTKFLKKKKIKFRRRSCAVKTEDFFDAGIMEGVQHRLLTLNDLTQLDTHGNCSSITFHSSIRARRIEGSGKVGVLLHWYPENILPDQWVLENQVDERSEWTVPLSALPDSALTINRSKSSLMSMSTDCWQNRRRLRKNCRK